MSLNDLPMELIYNISKHLNYADIVALRHASRPLVYTTQDSFMHKFDDKVTVTCS